MKLKKTFLILYILFGIIIGGVAQNRETQLANEYFNKRDYEKAYEYYQKLIKNDTERKHIYSNYITTVRKINDQKTAIKQLEKLLKQNSNTYTIQVDIAILKKDLGKQQDYDSEINKLINLNKNNPIEVSKLGNTFLLRKLTEETTKLYLAARKETKNDFTYAEELASVYKLTNQKNLMTDELLNVLETSFSKIDYVQYELQGLLTTKKDSDALIDKIYLKISDKNPNLQFNELLVWLYMQNKDFYNAFVQLRSIDKKMVHKRGTDLIELGDVAVKNQDYKNAIKIYDYVTTTYPNEQHYDKTKRKLIYTKELQYKNHYPIDTAGVSEVISDYKNLLKSSTNSTVNADIKISQAELYAVYLHQNDQAKKLLNEVIQTPRLRTNKIAEAKILLGDVYLLEGETGEAMIQYMQVERMIDDDDLGHLAKLKTAKVSYFEAEFELAQAHLDILKRATTRKIANDAQDLSLLIKGNLDLDTTAEAMTAYSHIELLVYQKKYNEALESLESINKKFPNHSLKDEIHYQRAQIFQEINEYQKAIVELTEVLKDKEGVLADDAVIQMARIYDFKLHDTAKAKEYYKKILLEFSGSLYVAEARKRFYNKSS